MHVGKYSTSEPQPAIHFVSYGTSWWGIVILGTEWTKAMSKIDKSHLAVDIRKAHVEGFRGLGV